MDLTDRITELLDTYQPEHGPDAEFWGLQFDLGLAWVHHGEGEGGMDADVAEQLIVDRALCAAGVPDRAWRSGVGLPLVAPTLAVYGTADQRRRHLRPLFTGEEIWCQLFSEPGAGSDIAGLATRAVRSEDHWLVNGQKVWTSLGHAARWGILCARTDPGAPKHKGLTYFIADMSADGIETRPLRQMTGEAEFDEVFLTDVVIPDEQRVGEVGNGWAVTLATLANERVTADELPPRGGGAIRHVLDAWQRNGSDFGHCRDRVLELAVRAEALRLTEAEAKAESGAGTPSSAWSFLKLASSELEQEILDLALTLNGPDGLRYGDYGMRVPDELTSVAYGELRRGYLFARALTIAGGTSEIQRTIIADRVLGLPREPQVDRDIAWRDLRRN
jgi:alkylation response protein AidB-like acyl-CoA dehydrogenase